MAGSNPEKLRCAACGHVELVYDRATAPNACRRCKSGLIQYIPDSVQIITIGGTNDGVKISSASGKDLRPTAMKSERFRCFGCGQEYDQPSRIRFRRIGLPCRSCKSRITIMVPFKLVGKYLQAQQLGVEGERLYGAERYRESIDKFREGLKLFPNDANLLLNLGNALGMLGWAERNRTMLKESAKYLKKAVKTFPGNSRAARNLEITHQKIGAL